MTEIMRAEVSIEQLRQCSARISGRAETQDVHVAMDEFMKYMTSTLTPDEHMKLTVDMICTLRLRDYDRYVAMIQSVAIHQLEQVIKNLLEGDNDASQPEEGEIEESLPPVQG